jgi:luciferase family oxidoreductase group 1
MNAGPISPRIRKVITMTPFVSILDLTPIETGSSPRQALGHSVELAILADRLGYHRIWFAEHHNTAGLASASPEIMIEHIASRTRHLRVGSGGVMLPNHSPLRIIEAFRLLEALHPGRIDLGLGRAPGTDTLTALAMRRSREALAADDYPEQLAELMAYDDEAFPADHPFRAIKAIPVDVKMPPLWLLGSSGFSAQLAAGVGLGFAFASHINFPAAVPALRTYRDTFVPSARFNEPWSILTLSVIVGETPEHAQRLSRIADLIRLRLRTGKLAGYPTLEEAERYPFTPEEQAFVASMPMRSVIGDAASVHRQIVDLTEQSRADEVMIMMLPHVEDRRRAIVHLASAFGLRERSTTSPIAGSVAA